MIAELKLVATPASSSQPQPAPASLSQPQRVPASRSQPEIPATAKHKKPRVDELGEFDNPRVTVA